MARLIDAKTIPEALDMASRMTEGGISESGEQKIRALYAKYKSYIDAYRGAIPALSVAQGLMHESNGDPEHTSDPLIGETGLWSILPGQAMGNNFDPFDAESNIWAGGRLRNERVKEIVEKWPWLKQSDPRDYTIITQKMPGSLGQGGFKAIMKRIFPKAPTGETLVHPYAYMQAWVRNSKNWGRIPTLGRQKPPLVAGRIVRDLTGEWLEKVGALAVPGQYVLIAKPAHLPPFDPVRYAKIWGRKVANMAKSSDKLYQSWYKQLVTKLGAASVASMASGQVGEWNKYLKKIKKGKLADAAEAAGEIVTSTPFLAGASAGTLVGVVVLAGVGYYLWKKGRTGRRGASVSGMSGMGGMAISGYPSGAGTGMGKRRGEKPRRPLPSMARGCAFPLRYANINDGKFDFEELRAGVVVEMEHTDVPECAKAIAKAHLTEIPNYYTRLLKMEREAGLGAMFGLEGIPGLPPDFPDDGMSGMGNDDPADVVDVESVRRTIRQASKRGRR